MTGAEQIARARRQQPIAELERKARKAGRRWKHRSDHGFSEEAKDLSFAKDHAWRMSFRARAFVEGRAPVGRCSSCWGLGDPVKHMPNCTLGHTPPQVYAGTMFTGAGPGPKGRLL